MDRCATHGLHPPSSASALRGCPQLPNHREPFPLPRMELNPDVGSILDFAYDDFRLVGYEHHPAIRAPIAV